MLRAGKKCVFPSQPIGFVFRNVNKEIDCYRKATTLDIWLCVEARILIETSSPAFFPSIFSYGEKKICLASDFRKMPFQHLIQKRGH